MKNLILLFAVISLTVNAQESISDTWKYGIDKQQHELIGHGFGVSGTSLMLNSNLGYGDYESALGVSIIASLPIGTKEWYDQSFKRNGFGSEQDIVWGFQGVIEGAFTTATMFKVSDGMLNQKVHGLRDSYLAPWLMIGGGSAFISEVVKYGVLDGYRPSLLNFGIKTVCYGVSMLTKHHFDKVKGKHKYFEDKFKL